MNFAKFLRTHFLKNISVGCFCYLRNILAHLATISECIAARSSSLVTKSEEFLNVNNDYYSPSLCTLIDFVLILGYYSNINLKIFRSFVFVMIVSFSRQFRQVSRLKSLVVTGEFVLILPK